MKWKWASSVAALSLGAVFCGAAPRLVVAQDQVPPVQDPPARAPQEPTSRWLWPRLKEGKLSLNFPFRFEGFERDGAPFTAPAYARTLRLALGYETPAYDGFSVFGQGEAAVVTGPADYSVPLPLSQNRPNLPIILDPKSMELSQG